MSKTEETATKLGISAAAMVTSAYLGSLIGDTGTLWGTGIGAIIGGAATELYQAGLDRSKHHFRSIKRRNRYFVLAGMMTAALAAAGYIGVTLVEASTGSTLHSITTGKKDYGTSIGGSSSSQPSSPTPSPSSTGSSSSPTSSSSSSASPSSVPTASVATPSASAVVPTPSVPQATIPASTSPVTTPVPTTPGG